MPTEHVPRERRVVGIDLGGASSDTTGYVVLEGADRPEIVAAGRPEKGGGPRRAEARLLGLVDRWTPSVVAIDAPLTLPPCLTCPSYCRGPGDLCELQAAHDLWDRGRNPVSQRVCELHVEEVVGERPLPTMQLGVIAARGVVFARRLASRGTPPSVLERGEVMEVYPRATLNRLSGANRRLAPKSPREDGEAHRERVLAALADGGMHGIDEHAHALSSAHVFDALIASYTGWLGKDRLEHPPKGFNLASGWIWFPRRAISPAA